MMEVDNIEEPLGSNIASYQYFIQSTKNIVIEIIVETNE